MGGTVPPPPPPPPPSLLADRRTQHRVAQAPAATTSTTTPSHEQATITTPGVASRTRDNPLTSAPEPRHQCNKVLNLQRTLWTDSNRFRNRAAPHASNSPRSASASLVEFLEGIRSAGREPPLVEAMKLEREPLDRRDEVRLHATGAHRLNGP